MNGLGRTELTRLLPRPDSQVAGVGGFAAHVVAEHEKRQPEDREGVLGMQFVILDLGQVVAGVLERAPTGQHQTATGARPR